MAEDRKAMIDRRLLVHPKHGFQYSAQAARRVRTKQRLGGGIWYAWAAALAFTAVFAFLLT